jgi:hypothetical protein
VHGVLSGAAADLEHAAAVGEAAAQRRQDRLAVALAGGGEGLVDGGLPWIRAVRRAFQGSAVATAAAAQARRFRSMLAAWTL